jgi:hypothetical protein
MSAMSDRLQSLRVFASAVQDDSMRDDLRQNIVRVVKSVSRMFEPQHLVQDWLHAQKQWLQEPDIVTLHWFSVIARQHRPLAKLDAGTRNLILSHIVDAQEDLRLDKEAPWWMREALEVGLRRLAIRLTHFEYFGHDALHAELVLQTQKTKALGEVLCGADPFAADDGGDPSSAKIWGVLQKATTIIVLAAGVVEAPNKAAIALHAYHDNGWEYYRSVTAKILPQRSPPKLLPPPSANQQDL